jgi:transcriptional regulator with XRE-family HTH domain
MEKMPIWREILGTMIRDAHNRQQLAERLKVNPITLTRWATGTSKPRPEKLRSLLGMLSVQDRERAMLSLSQDYAPHVLQEDTDTYIYEIHPEFYHRVLSTYATLPSSLREWSLNILIIQQILSHLDPREQGMAVFLAYCTFPSLERPVRSLRKVLGRGTAPWNYADEHSTQFFGAESLVGQAILRGHPLTVQSHEEATWLLSDHLPPQAESICAFPLLRANQAAGSLCIISTQLHFFSQSHLDLLQKYVNLLVTISEHESFFQLEKIAFGVIPPLEQQLPLLQSVQTRVMQRLLQASRQYHFLTKQQAENMIWQEIEEELLNLTYVEKGPQQREKIEEGKKQ